MAGTQLSVILMLVSSICRRRVAAHLVVHSISRGQICDNRVAIGDHALQIDCVPHGGMQQHIGAGSSGRGRSIKHPSTLPHTCLVMRTVKGAVYVVDLRNKANFRKLPGIIEYDRIM